MTTKTAEPPPPKGVSVKEWDKMLQKGPDKPVTKTAMSIDEARFLLATEGLPKEAHARVEEKTAAVEKLPGLAKRATIQDVRRCAKTAAQAAHFEYLTSPPPASTEDVILSLKLAAVEDQELLSQVYQLNEGVDDSLGQALRDYERMGGTYKVAFGQPMFSSNQLAGSPAVAFGGQQRASTTQAQQSQQAAAQPASPQSAKTPGAPSAASSTSTPSTPSMPTG